MPIAVDRALTRRSPVLGRIIHRLEACLPWGLIVSVEESFCPDCVFVSESVGKAVSELATEEVTADLAG